MQWHACARQAAAVTNDSKSAQTRAETAAGFCFINILYSALSFGAAALHSPLKPGGTRIAGSMPTNFAVAAELLDCRPPVLQLQHLH